MDRLIESPAVDTSFLRQAVQLARQARAEGNHPFGALLALDGRVVLTALNTVKTDVDPTAHAEANLVSRAIHQLSPDEVRRSVLYSSCEPCAMCAGKLYWAGIRTVVYALSAEALASLTGGSLVIPCRDIFQRAVDPVTVFGPLLSDEGLEVHRGFWTLR